jgi:hypothetical protein
VDSFTLAEWIVGGFFLVFAYGRYIRFCFFFAGAATCLVAREGLLRFSGVIVTWALVRKVNGIPSVMDVSEGSRGGAGVDAFVVAG